MTDEILCKIKDRINQEIDELKVNGEKHSDDVRKNGLLIAEGLRVALQIIREVEEENVRQFEFDTDTNVGGTNDTISRTAVLDAVDGVDWYHQNKNGEMVHGANSVEHQAWYKAEDIYRVLDSLPPAQPGQRNARVFQGIIVEYLTISTYPEYEGKPYFSIKYTENGQEFIGYGTYKPEVLSEYLKEYFMPPAQLGWATDVNDILAYLDGVVHPLVSPENWNVYSELHDMVSGLLKPWKEGQNDG